MGRVTNPRSVLGPPAVRGSGLLPEGVGGGLVEVEGGAGVFLEKACGAVWSDRALESTLNDGGFSFTPGEGGDFFGVEDGSAAHGDGLGGDVVDAVEEDGVALSGFFGEIDDAGAGVTSGAGFVEADVSGGADAEDLKVNAAGVFDGLFVGLTMLPEVSLGDGAVGDVDVVGVDVDVVEELVVHEVPVALRVLATEADVLVEVEGDDASEGEAVFGVEATEFLVEVDRGGTGGEAEDGGELFGLAGGNEVSDLSGEGLGGRVRVGMHLGAGSGGHDHVRTGRR